MKEYTFQEFLKEQAEEIKKYIWCKGVELNHDPLIDKTESEWGIEWVHDFAQIFRETHTVINQH
jgi:hypothetical protein